MLTSTHENMLYLQATENRNLLLKITSYKEMAYTNINVPKITLEDNFFVTRSVHGTF